MTKKSGEKSSGILSVIKDAFVSSLKASIKENFDQAMDALETRLLQLQRRALRSLSAALFALTAIVLLLLAATFYALDTLGVSRAGAFLALAAAFAIVALLFYSIDRDRR